MRSARWGRCWITFSRRRTSALSRSSMFVLRRRRRYSSGSTRTWMASSSPASPAGMGS